MKPMALCAQRSRSFGLACVLSLAAALHWPGPANAAAADFKIGKEPDAVVVKDAAGGELLRYQTRPLEGTQLSVPSAGFFHPFVTPNGIAITEVGPSDHRHHRGIFLAWVEMHGKKDADFWGWGEPAPKEGRRIVNKQVTGLSSGNRSAAFESRNEWLADEDTVVVEDLKVSFERLSSLHVLDLIYTLAVPSDITLARWAFSGFCVRTRADGSISAEGPDGVVQLPNPKHTEPASDWPAAKWYAYAIKLPDGTQAGVAVLDHPDNPPTLWHNHRDVRMLNPCIVAPAAVRIAAGKPLVLRYRVVAFDGKVPREELNRLAAQWSR